MPEIQNISLADATSRTGRKDRIRGHVSVIIRILDRHRSESEGGFEDHEFHDWPLRPYLANGDVSVHEFRFDDVSHGPRGIQESDAKEIGEILLGAVQRGSNVIVHCILGKNRSGGVVEAALASFQEFSSPFVNKYCNAAVKTAIMAELHTGYYDSENITTNKQD